MSDVVVIALTAERISAAFHATVGTNRRPAVSTFRRTRSDRGGTQEGSATISHRGGLMNLKGMASIVSELRAQRADFVSQIRHVDAALAVLGKVSGTRVSQAPARTISAAGRKRIAAAQRARWAKARGTAKVATPKRTMSASSRRKIAAAQRRRWAKVRAKQKG
jgi:hypothetical protein